MKNLTKKYKKNKTNKRNKKHRGGMKRLSSKDYSKNRDDYSFIPIDLSKSDNYLPRPGDSYAKFLPRPGSTDNYAKLIDAVERGESPAFSKKKSSSNEFKDALDGSNKDAINELFEKLKVEEEKLKVKEEKSKLKKTLRNTTKKINRKSKHTRKGSYDPVYSLVFDDPYKVKEVTKAFKKIDDTARHPTLLSMTMSSKSKK